ncbi:MAG: hypothetical protein KBT07_00470 [Clostridiales bacterium]|nr:hypothetical protein [Candidatus Scatonaster coprocaballi]
MKRWLQRANRGEVLLLLLLVGVVIYCCIDAQHNRKQRDRIKEVVYRHVEESTTLYSFPEIPDLSPQNAFDMSNEDCAPLYDRALALNRDLAENEAIRQELANKYVSILQVLAVNFRMYPTACTRQITAFNILEIYHDSATVRLEIENSFTLSDKEGKNYVNSLTSNEDYYLLMVDGQWKIISIDSSILSDSF